MYRYAKDFGIMCYFISSIRGLTNRMKAARRILELAAMDMFRSIGPIEMHGSIKDVMVNENHNLVDFIGSGNPHIAAAFQKAI